MIVLADSWRVGRCRSCGAPIEFITPLRTTNAVAFNPPIVFTRQLFDKTETETADVDCVKSVLHYWTCPYAEAWRRKHGVEKHA